MSIIKFNPDSREQRDVIGLESLSETVHVIQRCQLVARKDGHQRTLTGWYGINMPMETGIFPSGLYVSQDKHMLYSIAAVLQSITTLTRQLETLLDPRLQ
jgi:hypothetical protein